MLRALAALLLLPVFAASPAPPRPAAPGEPAPPASDAAEVTAGPVSLRPPPGFVPSGLGPRETAALAPAGSAAHRQVHLALQDPARGAALVISSADEPLGDGPDLRDRLAKRTVDHFRDLGLDLRLAWATRGAPPAPALEVAARAVDDGHELGLLVAYVPAGERTYVAVLSAPLGRFDALLPDVEASLRTLRVEARALPEDGGSARRAGAVAVAVAVAVASSWAALVFALRRRRGDAR